MPLPSILTKVIRDLRAEEARIERKLDTLREQIDKLSALTGSGKRGPGRPKAIARKKRKMTPAGRAAISKAAKKRWAAYRRAKAGK